MWIVESDHQEKGIVICRVQEFSHKKFYLCDVSSHLIDRVILFSLFVVEFENLRRPDVLFADQTGSNFVLSKNVGQALNIVEGIEVILSLV